MRRLEHVHDGASEQGERDHAAVARLAKRNPTAVQSGNRQATPLGERSRRNCRDPTVCLATQSPDSDQAERAEAGPGQEQLADRIGPIPEQAHAVTSRVTSWAFRFYSPPWQGGVKTTFTSSRGRVEARNRG